MSEPAPWGPLWAEETQATQGWKLITLEEFVSIQRGHDLPDTQRNPGRVPILGSFGITGYHDESKARGPVLQLEGAVHPLASLAIRRLTAGRSIQFSM